jgi:hypothetical protein
MKRKLFWIISADFDVKGQCILHSSNTREEMGIQRGIASVIYRLQGSLRVG